MVLGPAQAAAEIDSFLHVEASPTPVRALLLELIVDRGWFEGDEAAEKAEVWVKSFTSRLVQRLNDDTVRRSFVPYAFNSNDSTFIQGACFCEPGDDEVTRADKAKRARTVPIAQRIEGLTPTEFERLCTGMLRFFGVTEPHLTRRSADGGIDFFGQAPFSRVLASKSLPGGVEKDLNVWLVGQAKHYNATKVSVKELRELVGSTELARSHIFAGIADPNKDFIPRLCDPIFYMLVTSGRFTRDSYDLIERAGIIAMDQMMLAQFLADNGVGGDDQIVTPAELIAWIDGVQSVPVQNS